MVKTKQGWQELSAKFAALKQREKHMIAAAIGLVIVVAGYVLGVEPTQSRIHKAEKQLAQQQGEQASLQAQVDMLRLRLNDPDAANRSALTTVKKQLDEQDTSLRKFDGALVPPDKISQFLETLLRKHQGLQLLSLRTLPATPLNSTKATEKVETKAGEVPAPQKLPAGQIYRHGIELKLSGNYSELLAYLTELENAKQRPLWSSMEFSVVRHPRAELTLTLYSMSLDSIWLLM